MGIKNVKNAFLRSNGTLVASIVAAICFFAGIAVTSHVAHLVGRELVLQHKRQVAASLSEARARLEGEFNRIAAHGLGIRAYVAQFNDRPFDPRDFREIAVDLIEENPSIRSIGLAPGNVLRAVYPLAPNQAALGLDYRTNSAQWPAVMKAMETREIVIAGPLELVQGGSALLLRIPVFPAGFPGQPLKDRTYWGVATLILDKNGMMANAGISEIVNGVRIAILDTNAQDETHTLVFGNTSVAELDHVAMPLHLPGGLKWELFGYPLAGWSNTGNEARITQVVGSMISLIFGAMAFLLISEVYKVRSMALHDALTGLANRRLLEDRMHQLVSMCERSGSGFEILYVDLDAFKPVNDNYGHSMGDQLLVEVGKRLLSQVRQSDTVARVGGDEFIVLTPGNMERAEKEAFQKRLSERVAQVFECGSIRIDVKASFGSASYPGDATTVDDLLRAADNRMYADKAASKRASRDIPDGELPQTT